MDYFARVERDLRAAARHRAHASWYGRAASRHSRLLLVGAACLLMAGSALAATGVIPLGSTVRVPGALNPRAGSGVPAPGGSRLLPLSVPDPEGGPPWGVRVVRTTRGLVCLQTGRLQDARLGELGIDGAFGNDGHFHPLPAAALPDSVPGHGYGRSELGENATCHLPEEAFSGERIGVERSAAGPADTSRRPRAQLRDLFFGNLGPQAISVTYRAGAGRRTQPVVPGVGAYLIVLPTTRSEQLATGGGSMGSAGGLSPVAPLTAIAYRLNGSVCERLLSGRGPRPCAPPQSLYVPPSPSSAPSLHQRLDVELLVSRHVVSAAKVSFRGPFAVTGAAQSYEVRIPLGRCHTGGQLGGYTAVSTDRDIAAGEPVTQQVAYPFSGACGGRSVTFTVLYLAAGHPPVTVGTFLVRQPAGTLAEPSRAARPGRAAHHQRNTKGRPAGGPPSHRTPAARQSAST